MYNYTTTPNILQLGIEFENGEIGVAVPLKGNSIVKNGVIVKYDENFPQCRYEIIKSPYHTPFKKLVLYDNDSFKTIKNKLIFYVDSKEVLLKKCTVQELEWSYDMIDKCSSVIGQYFVDRKDLYLNVINSLIREKKLKTIINNIKNL